MLVFFLVKGEARALRSNMYLWKGDVRELDGAGPEMDVHEGSRTLIQL